MYKLGMKTRAELAEQSRENIEYIFDWFKQKLKVVNTGAISAKSFDTENYAELLDLYEFMSRKESFTMNEIEGIVAELGSMRKK